MLLKVTRRSFLLGGGAAVAGHRAYSLPPGLDDVDFSFIQVTDTHISASRLYSASRGYDVPAEESVRRARAAVKSINECSLPYEIVVHTGDVADKRDTLDDYDLAQELLQFERKTYYLPGNHDVGYSETDAFRPEFEKRFGSTYQAIEPVKGLRMVMFDSQPLDPRGDVVERRNAVKHLDRLLTPAMPTIFCCHVMGLSSFHVNRLFPGWPDEIMDYWTERMKKGGVIAVLAGHFHRDEQQIVNGIPFHLCGPVINMWDRQTCYRHWTISKGQLSYRTVYLEI